MQCEMITSISTLSSFFLPKYRETNCAHEAITLEYTCAKSCLRDAQTKRVKICVCIKYIKLDINRRSKVGGK